MYFKVERECYLMGDSQERQPTGKDTRVIIR